MQSFLDLYSIDIFVRQSRFLTPTQVSTMAEADSTIAKLMSNADFWMKRFDHTNTDKSKRNIERELIRKDENNCSWLSLLASIADTRLIQIHREINILHEEIKVIDSTDEDKTLKVREIQHLQKQKENFSSILNAITAPVDKLVIYLKHPDLCLHLLGYDASLIDLIPDPLDKLIVVIKCPEQSQKLPGFNLSDLCEKPHLSAREQLQELLVEAVIKNRLDVVNLILSSFIKNENDAFNYVSYLIEQQKNALLDTLFKVREHLLPPLNQILSTNPAKKNNARNDSDISPINLDNPNDDEKNIVKITLIKRFYNDGFSDAGYRTLKILKGDLYTDVYDPDSFRDRYALTDTACNIVKGKRGALLHALFENNILNQNGLYDLLLQGNSGEKLTTKMEYLDRSHLAAIADAPESVDSVYKLADVHVGNSMIRATSLHLAIFFNSHAALRKLLNKDESYNLKSNNQGHNAFDIVDRMFKDEVRKDHQSKIMETAKIIYTSKLTKKNEAYLEEREEYMGTKITCNGVTQHYGKSINLFGKKYGLGFSFEEKKAASLALATYMEAGGKGELPEAAKHDRLGKIYKEYEAAKKKYKF